MKRCSFLKQTGLMAIAFTVPGRKMLATVKQSKAQKTPTDYTSKVPKFTFGKTLGEQEKQLAKNLNFFVLIILGTLLLGCDSSSQYLPERQLGALKEIAKENQWIEYSGNPVIKGTPGEFDAGALGNMSVVLVNDTIHVFYEAWQRRQEIGFPRSDYRTLSVGHATSVDGIHFVKDENNPVLPRGAEGEFDHTGTWDPFVLYEDGIFKMWYGGGGAGARSNMGYATSTDGSHFTKQMGFPDGHGNEIHVVHDKEGGRYRMYYFWIKERKLRMVESENETDFDFKNGTLVKIEGELYPGEFKYTHVIIENGKWYMFYSNFYNGCGGLSSTVRMATSSDGVNWKLVNNNILPGLDAEILKVGKDLYALYHAFPGDYDEKDAAINLTVYKGKLDDISIKREPVVASEEIKERVVARKTENQLFSYNAADYSDEQLECLEQILKERNRKDFEIRNSPDLLAQKKEYRRIFNEKLINCIGEEKQGN